MFNFRVGQPVVFNSKTVMGRKLEQVARLRFAQRLQRDLGWSVVHSVLDTPDRLQNMAMERLWPGMRFTLQRWLVLLDPAPTRPVRPLAQWVSDWWVVVMRGYLLPLTGGADLFDTAKERQVWLSALRNVYGRHTDNYPYEINAPVLLSPRRRQTLDTMNQVYSRYASLADARRFWRDHIEEHLGSAVPLLPHGPVEMLNRILQPGSHVPVPAHLQVVDTSRQLKGYQIITTSTLHLPRAKPRKVKGLYVRDSAAAPAA